MKKAILLAMVAALMVGCAAKKSWQENGYYNMRLIDVAVSNLTSGNLGAVGTFKADRSRFGVDYGAYQDEFVEIIKINDS
jgi:hypothetical protein